MIKFTKVKSANAGSCNYCDDDKDDKYINSLEGGPSTHLTVRFCDDCLDVLLKAVKQHIKFNKQFEEIVQ